MSNKSKRFSVGGLFSKTASPTKDKSQPAPKKRENSHLIKSRGGKRLTVYLPDGLPDTNESPIDDRKSPPANTQSLKSITTAKSIPEQIPQQEINPVVKSLPPVKSPNDYPQRQVSTESVSSSVYPDVSRNATISSSIYPQTPKVGLSAKNTISTRNHNPYEEAPLRNQSTRNPTLLRKRKPPPLPLNVITDRNEKTTNNQQRVQSPVSVIESPSNEYIKTINNELQNYPNPSTDAIGSINDSHYSPLNIRHPENDLVLNPPLCFMPVNIKSVDAPVKVFPASPITDNNDDNTRQEIQQEKYDDYVSDSDSDILTDENIPRIKMHVPTIRETIAQTPSPEFEVSKDFSMHDRTATSTHKHSRTISSVEDITNAIDSFQLSHPMVPEEDDDEEYMAVTDHDHTNSFQKEHELDLSQQISPQEEKDLEEGGLYLKVADLPELEQGQTIDEYVLNLEKEIAENKISVQSSPIKLLDTPVSKFREDFSKPSPIRSNLSGNSSISDVFYEAEEGQRPVSAVKLAFDDLVEGEDEEVAEADEIASTDPSVEEEHQENQGVAEDEIDEIYDESQLLDVPPPYTSTPSSPIQENSTHERDIGLDDEIENTVAGTPTIESVDDFYPDAASDDEDSLSEDDNGLLEFKAAKSPVSEKFQFGDNMKTRAWQEYTPDSFDGNSFDSMSDSPDRVQDKSHLMVINGTPESAGTPHERFDMGVPLEAPPLPLLPSQYSLDRELSDKTITTVKDEPPSHEFPIYDRREEPYVSPIQHSTVIMPAAPLLKKPLVGSKRPIPDFPNGGRRSRGLSMTTTNPELFTKKEVLGVTDNERPGRGERSKYVDGLRSNGKSVNSGKLNPAMLPVSLKSVDNKIVKKTASNAALLFGASKPRTRVLASEMDDNELPDATQLHSGKTKVPIHPDAEMIATNEEFRKMAEEEHLKSRNRRRSSASSVAPQVQRMKLYIVNPDSD